jgi:uncharacterized protein
VRIVADSNIFISAFIWGSLPVRLVESAIRGEITLYISQPIIASTTLVTPVEKLSVIASDPDDDKIIECAVAVGADAIISCGKPLAALGPVSRNQDYLVKRLAEQP